MTSSCDPVNALLRQAEAADIRLTPGMAEGIERGNPRMIAYVADLITLRGKRPAIEPRYAGGPMVQGRTYTVNEHGPETVVDWDGKVKPVGDGSPALVQPQKPAVVLPRETPRAAAMDSAPGIPDGIANHVPASAASAPRNDYADWGQAPRPQPAPSGNGGAQDIVSRLDFSAIPGMSRRPDVPLQIKAPESSRSRVPPEASPPASTSPSPQGAADSCAVKRHDPPEWKTPAIWNRVLGENLK